MSITAFTIDHGAIGADLKRVRIALKLSLADVAKEAGIAASHVWNLENGVKEMSLEKFFRLCAVLCVPSSQLLADNLRVDRDVFFRQAVSGLQAQFVDVNILHFLADYVAGCATIFAYLLLTPEVSGLAFTYPTKDLEDAFRGIQMRIVTLGLRDRRTLLSSIQSNPVRTLDGFGLIKPEMFGSFIKAKEPIKAGSKECPPWLPTRSRAFLFFETSSDSLAGLDPVALGAVLRQLADQQSDALLGIKKIIKQTIKQGKKRKRSP